MVRTGNELRSNLEKLQEMGRTSWELGLGMELGLWKESEKY